MEQQLTPMMQQYMEIKEKHRDCILFFRLGDFYEMFFDDAIVASKALEITLTKKNCGLEEKAPMCGIPYHAVDGYLAKLVEKGHKVAICEQVEDPATAKGIVKRDVIQIVTPGTLTSGTMLKEQENNYLASLFWEEDRAGLVFCDISTGELSATEIIGNRRGEILLNELSRIKAREVLVNPFCIESGFIDEVSLIPSIFISELESEKYDEKTTKRLLDNQFGSVSLKSLGIDEKESLLRALRGLLYYLEDTQKQTLAHITTLHLYDLNQHMSLDRATLRNLELTETIYDQQVAGSLLSVLDKTHTAMGGRRMKKWLREPLNTSHEINSRLNAVEALTGEILLRNNLKETLKRIYDLERLAGRLSCGNANGKDLIALRNSLAALPELKEDILSLDTELLNELASSIDNMSEAENLITSAICEDPPFILREGGLIKDGYSKELDELKNSIKDGQVWIASLEGTERERTGIKNLKVGFNKVFGYYIEITKSNYDLIPETYIRKQTLVNCERFITPELKEVEAVVLNAETKINQMEYDLFTTVRNSLMKYIPSMQLASSAISQVDVLVSFAEVASRLGYVKPQVNDGDEILIEKGRHPVIENTIKDGLFVANDTYLDREKNSMLLITGPNMAGKSTYMRQTALIVLMAQIGSFVPAERAVIGTVDRIYTRIGASDNLAYGQSTFYVEMSELAYILNTASERSLVILDEIGRGTSTYDGLSIAWAAIEYLCRENKQIRTLFATHYHELTSLEGSIAGVRNLNVDVSDDGGDIVFLHKIVSGSASRSYGIHVAKLAGVPATLLDAAEHKLETLEDEKSSITGESIVASSGAVQPSSKGVGEQLSFFSFAPNPVVEKLKALDLMEITPSKAFSILEELKQAADKEK